MSKSKAKKAKDHAAAQSSGESGSSRKQPGTVVLTEATVLKAEFDEIEKQREKRLAAYVKVAPDAPKDLVGLCFSGGGIRSATLNLGILQGLQETGVLKHVDYLSTVSGGGYIGSWFCATRRRLAAAAKAKNQAAKELLEDDRFLIENEATDRGSPMLRHLRQHARYLAPESGITSGDFWTMISIWTRNTLLMQVTVLSALFFLISFFQAVPAAFQWLVRDGKDGSSLWWALMIVQVAAVALACGVSFWELFNVIRGDKAKYQAASAGLPASLITISLALASICGGAQIFARFADDKESVWTDPACLAFAGVLALSGSIVMAMARFEKPKPGKWFATIASELSIHLVCFAALGATVMAVMWLMMKVFHAIGSAHLLPSFTTPELSDYYTSGAIAWSSIISVPMLLGGYGLVMIMAAGLLGRHTKEAAMEWLARAGAWLVMAILLSGLVLAVAVAGPVWVDYLLSDAVSNWLRTSLIGGWVAGSISAVIMGRSESTSGSPAGGGVKEKLLGMLPLVLLGGVLLSMSWLVREAFVYALPDRQQIEPDGPGFVLEYFCEGKGFDEVWCVVTGISFVVALLLIWRVDINQFSMNPFYRNRLVRCYLGASRVHKMSEGERFPHGATGFDFDDDLPLTTFAGDAAYNQDYAGPFQIINTAANTAASAGLDVQDRSAESFTFTALHAGFNFARFSMPKAMREAENGPAAHLAYCPVDRYGGGWSLGHALSVSGAAASPNSGFHTSPLVAFMLTVFNARLGWWSPHPGKEKAGEERPNRWYGFLGCLINELVGNASLKERFIYLSDGGHFENLGLYELVRRQCRVIIVGDGECDPTYNFQALGTAIRRCKVDFGTKIEIETRDIRPDPTTGLGRAHCAFGRIQYAGGKPGLLIYMKSSMTGDESLAVRQFRGESPAFPHESTGDQFFSESQFESYRELGRHIAREAFEPVPDLKRQSKELFQEWLDRLEKYWSPPPRISSASFVNHSVQLTAIWRETQNDPALAEFDNVIMPEWSALHDACKGLPVPEKSQPALLKPLKLAAEPARKAAYLCQELLQLMENVYLDLDLHHAAGHQDHRGWMELFRYWAKQPVIRKAWEHSHKTFGERFENFCDEVLGMPVPPPAEEKTESSPGSSDS